jgi:hypothetical protein
MISATQRTQQTTAIIPAFGMHTVVTGNNAALLPAPAPMSSVMLNDAMAMLLAATAQQTASQLKQGESQINAARNVNALKHAELEKKFKEWEAAQNNPFKFLIDMFKAIVTALSAVASACTGGALSGLLAGAVALSVAGFVVEKTQMFGPEASKWLSMVMNILSSLVGGGANIAGIAGATADTLTKTVARAAEVAGSLAEIGGGAATIGSAVKDRDAILAQADMTQIRHTMAKMQKFVEMIIDGMKETEDSHRNAVKTVANAIDTNHQAATAISGMRV